MKHYSPWIRYKNNQINKKQRFLRGFEEYFKNNSSDLYSICNFRSKCP